VGLLLAGCAGATGPSGGSLNLFEKLLGAPPVEPAPPPAPAPVVQKESCGTPAQCKTALKKMVESPKRGWVGQEQDAAAYADGTRLFAYRALRTKLSCRELSAALGEVRTASKSLAGEVQGVTPDQLARTRALSTQVEGELARERSGRCKS
jgi:hypothetical protein